METDELGQFVLSEGGALIFKGKSFISNKICLAWHYKGFGAERQMECIEAGGVGVSGIFAQRHKSKFEIMTRCKNAGGGWEALRRPKRV